MILSQTIILFILVLTYESLTDIELPSMFQHLLNSPNSQQPRLQTNTLLSQGQMHSVHLISQSNLHCLVTRPESTQIYICSQSIAS